MQVVEKKELVLEIKFLISISCHIIKADVLLHVGLVVVFKDDIFSIHERDFVVML